VPQVEAWEKVMVAAGFGDMTHGRLRTCVACHGGNSAANLTKEQAHEGVVRDPSLGDAEACVDCHADEVENHAASVHATQSGYWTSFERRIGSSTVTPELQAMFDAACAKCHTSCGQCHVSRPVAVEGGLVREHEFYGTPNQNQNCTACHGSRIWDEYSGRNSGVPADAHYLQGKNCFFCHSEDEIHGDGSTPDTRWEVAAMPECQDCHTYDTADTSNAYHTADHDSVSCNVCHSGSYKTCYNCHVGEGIQDPSRIDFRIGKNHLQSARRPWEFVLLRHVPIAPNSFADWGVTMAAYDSWPTWVYASPHNIRKNTPQTATCNACHGNGDRFLTSAYVDSLIAEGIMHAEEIAANAPVVVDSLP
jgi:thiosulfate/3-mercaptopyruvate sulfurtransferase